MIDTKPLEALESKITQILERVQKLQVERNELQSQFAALQTQCDETTRQLEEVARERDTLKRNQRDVEQEELIRTKITALLAKLEAA